MVCSRRVVLSPIDFRQPENRVSRMHMLTGFVYTGAVLCLCAYGCGNATTEPVESGGAGGHSAGSAGSAGGKPQGGTRNDAAGSAGIQGVGGDALAGAGNEGGGAGRDELSLGGSGESGAGQSGAGQSGAGQSGAGGEAPTTLGDGLVSWWRGEGNALDSVGANNGTTQGGVAFVAGRIGQSFEFHGTDAVTIPTSSTLDVTNGYTLAYWIKAQAWPSNEVLVVNKWQPSALEDKLLAVEPSGKISLYLSDAMNRTRLDSLTALTVDTWHHVAATYDGTKARLYVDGLLDASVSTAGNVYNGSGTLAFGHNAVRAAQEPGFNTFFTGELDEVRWYVRPLSGAEISALAAGKD